MIQDPVETTVMILEGVTEVNTLVNGHIAGGEIKQAVIPSMPQKYAIVAFAGASAGGYNSGYLPIIQVNLDVRCYGETLYEAVKVHRAIFAGLKYFRRDVQNNSLVHSYVPVAGPIQSWDPDGHWPMVVGTYTVTMDERAVA